MDVGRILEYLGETATGTWPATPGGFARVREGRLVEVRVGRLARLADVESLNAAVREAMRSAGPEVLVCADHRFAFPLPCDLADPWSRAMRGVNRSVIRSAFLLNPANTTFNLQIQRVIQCAGSDRRRVFTDQQELVEWLGALLTEPERAALRAFLDGPA
jgi:hypothetical protein